MTDDPFVTHRSLLFTVAYEMLGSAADAEDVVQETWLRWAAVDQGEVRAPRAGARRRTTAAHRRRSGRAAAGGRAVPRRGADRRHPATARRPGTGCRAGSGRRRPGARGAAAGGRQRRGGPAAFRVPDGVGGGDRRHGVA